MKSTVLSVLIAAALVACGGGGGGGGGDNSPVVDSQSGILSDSPVQGVDYVTSSGVRGQTDAEGKYNFNPGDTVTFRLGSLVLGEQPAKGLLTPLDLAAGDPTKLTNLLVVLQSLDSDGDASNGISIPAAAAAAMPSIDLATASGSTLNQALQTAMTSGGITTPIKTPEQAREHFLAQAPTLLASNIWVSSQDGVPMMALQVKANGKYLFGEADVADDDGEPGTEYGTIAAIGVDAKGFVIKTTFGATGEVDTNGEWGLSSIVDSERISLSGDVLTVTDATSSATAPLATFTKMENVADGIVGAWVLADMDGKPMEGRMFLFFSNGKVMMVDGIGDVPEPGDTSCGGPGVEVGNYTYNATTKTVTGSGDPLYNTNGCAGLWEADGTTLPFQFVLGANGLTAQMTGTDSDGSWTENLVRVSK